MTRATSKRAKFKGRRDSGTFSKLPHEVANCPRFLALSGNAVKLLIDLLGQFNGSNNGSMAIPMSRMRERGWRSQGTLWRALGELIEQHLVIRTRQGGLHGCSLFALTWLAIDDNPRQGIAGTVKPLGGWHGPIPGDPLKRPRMHWANPKRPKADDASASAITAPENT